MTEILIERRLDVGQRARLAELADVLITGGLGLLSASEAKVHEKWIDRALSARPDLFDTVATVLDAAGDPSAALKQLKQDDVNTFDSFAFVVAGAYLMNPAVCKALGLPGNAPKPRRVLPDESDHYLEEGLLDPVVERGPIYRPTPPSA